MSSCAPYGIIPCTKHENVSSRLAARRGGMPKRCAMLREMVPTEIMATVLFAVQMSAKTAREAMAAVTFQPFQIRFSRIGFFQRPDGDIWWAGADESEELMTMQGSLHRQLLKRGLSLEKRKYRPHVTLGRRVISSCRSGRIEPVTACVSSISLMLSERSEHGMIYSELFSSGPGQGWSE